MARQGRSCSCRSRPPDMAPEVLGALAVGGLCLLACFFFTDFSSHCTGQGVLLMGGWVLAVRGKILGRIRKCSNLTGFTRPPQQGRVPSPEPASWSREAVPWDLGLSSSLPSRGLQSGHRKTSRGGWLYYLKFLHFSAYLALQGWGGCLGKREPIN